MTWNMNDMEVQTVNGEAKGEGGGGRGKKVTGQQGTSSGTRKERKQNIIAIAFSVHDNN